MNAIVGLSLPNVVCGELGNPKRELSGALSKLVDLSDGLGVFLVLQTTDCGTQIVADDCWPYSRTQTILARASFSLVNVLNFDGLDMLSVLATVKGAPTSVATRKQVANMMPAALTLAELITRMSAKRSPRKLSMGYDARQYVGDAALSA